MEFSLPINLTIIKKHPIAITAIITVGVIILYMLMKRSQRSRNSSVSGTPMTDTSLAAFNSGGMIQSAQINAGVQVAQLQGQVASSQIAAELEAVKVQQQTALAIVGKQEDVKLAVAQDVDASSLAATQANANAAIQIETQNANTIMGIANLQHDYQLQHDATLRDITNRFGTQKELGSKIVGVLAAFQGPQGIAASQPTQVAQAHADAQNGIAGIIHAFNPASLLASLFG